MSLTQAEFLNLIDAEKRFKESDVLDLSFGWSREITSEKVPEGFILDFYRGNIELTKFTYNKRFRKCIVLVRYDSRGRHTNPDGTRFDGPHLHVYKEGFDDKLAVPISYLGITNPDDMSDILSKFLEYCRVVDYPLIQTSILS